MDSPEATKLVYDRIQKLEPQLVSKIVAYVLLQDNGEQEMIRFACGPDNSIHSLIAEAKLLLFGNYSNAISAMYQHSPISPGSNFRNGTIWLDAPGLDLPEGFSYPKQVQRMSSSPPPHHRIKPCLYFLRGSCKHGSNCRFSHVTPSNGQNFPQHGSLLPNDPAMEDQGLSRGTLEKLELEISELLKSRGGSPVSIASLPMLYYEKYGKTLQAEGYLTESQRNGKTGYSLSKLLGRLKNSIRLIDRRPHGQHSVILAEDFHKYSDYDRTYPIVSGSPEQQIYLTFPADSAFTERDVSNYFSEYGPVLDVRIPCQHKRMFGFVTFVFPETAKQILAMGRPHFICQARVLVKPYKEKDNLHDRKCPDKTCYNQRLMENESEIHSMPEFCGVSRFPRYDQAEEHEYARELERMRLAELQVAPNEFPQNHNFAYYMDHLNPPEAINQPSSSEHTMGNHMNYSSFNIVNNGSCRKDQPSSSEYTSGNHMDYSSFDVVNNGSCSKEKIFNWNDQDSCQGINLPESPFSSSLGLSIVTTQQSLELDRT